MSQMLRSSGAMAAATLTSRVLGMVREMVYAAFMGNGWVASAFQLAFTVPNLFRRLLGEGALTAAFIPIFKKKQVTEGEAEMWRCSNAVISGLVASAAVVTVVVMAVLGAILLGGVQKTETRLMLQLLWLMFPYMLLVCLAAVLIGMANARGHFFVPALGSVILNVVMIASVFFLAPRFGVQLHRQIFGLAIGVLLAGVAQAFFQVPTLMREGYRYQWVSPWSDPTVREVVRKMLPGSIGVAAFQVNVMLTQGFSYWFDPTIVSTFNYAVRLMELPQGMFGISLATYLLPTLAGMAAEKKFPEFRHTLKQGVENLAFANLAAAAVSLTLAEPIVRLLFERGHFGPGATHRVALVLMGLAPGLLMFSLNNILARAFFALNDIKTPMKISVFCLMLNLVLAFWFLKRFQTANFGGEAGLAVANTVSGTCNTFLLVYSLRRKLGRLEMRSLKSTLLLLLSAAVLAGVTAALLIFLWEREIGHGTFLRKLGAVFVPGAAAGLVYWGSSLWMGLEVAHEMTQLVVQRFARRGGGTREPK